MRLLNSPESVKPVVALEKGMEFFLRQSVVRGVLQRGTLLAHVPKITNCLTVRTLRGELRVPVEDGECWI